jgi:rhodanese-related sulfurtransferase/DNA-directed RNA polymerase subunit RPC12/RpoP
MMHRILILIFTIVIFYPAYSQNNSGKDVYVCLPCGSDCDRAEYNKPGQCEHCQMPLVLKSTIKHTSVKPEEICKFIAEHRDVVLLDVRTQEEYEGKVEPNFGTLKNAINVPVQQLEARMSELERYKGKTILVFCSHSHRSPRASYMLTQHGFNKVVNMDGGMSVMTDNSCRK